MLVYMEKIQRMLNFVGYTLLYSIEDLQISTEGMKMAEWETNNFSAMKVNDVYEPLRFTFHGRGYVKLESALKLSTISQLEMESNVTYRWIHVWLLWFPVPGRLEQGYITILDVLNAQERRSIPGQWWRLRTSKLTQCLQIYHRGQPWILHVEYRNTNDDMVRLLVTFKGFSTVLKRRKRTWHQFWRSRR